MNIFVMQSCTICAHSLNQLLRIYLPCGLIIYYILPDVGLQVCLAGGPPDSPDDHLPQGQVCCRQAGATMPQLMLNPRITRSEDLTNKL
jgi:hypothetical protein